MYEIHKRAEGTTTAFRILFVRKVFLYRGCCVVVVHKHRPFKVIKQRKEKRMKEKAQIMDKAAMERGITRISHEILERNKGTDDLIIVGIYRRGIPLAEKIAKKIMEIEHEEVPVGEIDVSSYRDDIEDRETARENMTKPDIDITGKKVVLVDDVLYTGRTIRAAMDALIDIGRPKLIQLAVLIDRGHRELPIRADYVGKNVPTSHSEIVNVNLDEVDGKTGVYILED